MRNRGETGCSARRLLRRRDVGAEFQGPINFLAPAGDEGSDSAEQRHNGNLLSVHGTTSN